MSSTLWHPGVGSTQESTLWGAALRVVLHHPGESCQQVWGSLRQREQECPWELELSPAAAQRSWAGSLCCTQASPSPPMAVCSSIRLQGWQATDKIYGKYQLLVYFPASFSLTHCAAVITEMSGNKE